MLHGQSTWTVTCFKRPTPGQKSHPHMKINLTPRYKAALCFATLLACIVTIALIADHIGVITGKSESKNVKNTGNPKTNTIEAEHPNNGGGGLGNSLISIENLEFSTKDVVFKASTCPDYELKDVPTAEFFNSLEIPKLRNKPGFVGVSNKGNSCYADAMLQMIYRIPAYRKVVGNVGVFVETLKKIIEQDLERCRQGKTSLYMIKEKVKGFDFIIGMNRIFYQLQNNAQGNAAEFDKLSRKCMPGEYDTFDQNDSDQYFMSVIGHVTDILPKSLDKFFFTKFEEINVENGRKLENNMPRLTLTPKNQSANLIELIRDYFTDDENRRDKRLTSIPDILPILVQRLIWDKKAEKKVRTNVEFGIPAKLDMAPFYTPSQPQSEAQSTEFALKMFVVHNGSANGGHYFAYAREDDGQWTYLNDSHSSPVSEEAAFTEAGKGYMFFYERING